MRLQALKDTMAVVDQAHTEDNNDEMEDLVWPKKICHRLTDHNNKFHVKSAIWSFDRMP